MFAANADLKFYQAYAHSGINRRLNEGLLKELKDSGVNMQQSADELANALRDKPGVVLGALWEGIKDLPKSVIVEKVKTTGVADMNLDIGNFAVAYD